MQKIDARGKQCPIPVIETKKALDRMEEGEIAEVSVDDFIAVQNLLKMAGQKKLQAEYEERGDFYIVRITAAGNKGAKGYEKGRVPDGGKEAVGNPDGGKETVGNPDGQRRGICEENSQGGMEEKSKSGAAAGPADPGAGTVVVLSSDKMGEGDEKLGRILMKGFLYALTAQETLPQTILLYNGGARLSAEGSESLEDLRLMEAQGVEIVTCGTCINHYKLPEKPAVGTVTNMYAIAEKLVRADKLVRP